MPSMKPRRVGSAFIDLDPLNVIREKDRKSRKTSNGATRPNPADGPTTSGEQPGKNPKTIYDDKPAVGVISPENSSESARVTHVDDATKHATSTTQQPGKANARNSSLGAAKAKENPALVSSKLNVESTSRAEATVVDTVTAASKSTKPAKNTQHGSTLFSSRPKRVARKRYTKVDWYEDLRPTDDESPKVENDFGKSSISSPEPEYTESPSKPSPPKRKRRQSAPNSSKRRKGTKGKAKASDQGEAQKLQLPLTAAPTKSLVNSLGTSANPASKESDVQPGRSDTKRTAKDSADSLLPKAPEQDPKEDHHDRAQLEIIEISSVSPLSTDESDSDHDMDEAAADVDQAAEVQMHGGGKSFGQKLADALRVAGVSTQRLPITNNGSHLTQTSQWASMLQKSCSPISCASSSRHSLQHGALATDFDLAQVQSNPAMTQQEGSEPAEPTIVPLDMVSEACPVTSSPVRGTAACTDKTPLREPHSLRELFSQASLDMASDKDVVGSQWVTLRDYSEADPSSESSCNDSRHSILSHTGDSQAIMQNQKSEAEDSSRSSAAAITDPPTALLTAGSGNEHTPESQQPLLTKGTPRRPMPMSIPRSSIVDDNGSPRLIERGRAGSLRFGRLLSLATTDSSQSSHERTSVDCSDDYTPHDRPSLSKFHLDMLLEYGIEAEDLFKRRSRSTLFRSHTTSGGTRLRASRCMEQETKLTTVSSRQSDDSNAVEKGTGDSDQGKASKAGPSSSQRTIDEVGLCTNRSSGGHRHPGKLSSTDNTSQFQPSPELFRPTMQDDADGMAWISTLQTAQRSAHSLLQQTNQNLSVQLAAEQDIIRQVLQIYRQGCHRILNDLFRAQEARMELYRQQMSSVKEQHTQICQELIRGLQELDHRVQQGA